MWEALLSLRGGTVTETRFLSNARCVIQKQRRHCPTRDALRAKIERSAKENICISQALFLRVKHTK